MPILKETIREALNEPMAPRLDGTTNVWVPGGTAARHRALLEGDIELHVLPSEGPLPEQLGPGQFVVADFWRRGFLDVVGGQKSIRIRATRLKRDEVAKVRQPETD